MWASFFKSPEEVWGFFEYFAHETWEFENARWTLGYSTPGPYAYDVQPYATDQLVDPYFQPPHIPQYAPVMCTYCQSYNHNTNSCPHHSISNAPYVGLEKLVEKFVENCSRISNECRELGLVHEIDSSPSSSRHEVCRYDDCESSFPRGLDSNNDKTLTYLEEESDLHLLPSFVNLHLDPYLAHLGTPLS